MTLAIKCGLWRYRKQTPQLERVMVISYRGYLSIAEIFDVISSTVDVSSDIILDRIMTSNKVRFDLETIEVNSPDSKMLRIYVNALLTPDEIGKLKHTTLIAY